MAIEFRCAECGRLLRTRDHKAGLEVNCPQCGAIIQIPDPESSPYKADVEPDFDEGVERRGGAGTPAGTAASSGGEATKTCPMCGERVRATSVSCHYCGEDLGPAPAEFVPIEIDAGEVFSKSWTIFSDRMGLCVGGVLLANVISSIIGAPANVINLVIEQGGIGPNAVPAALAVAWGFTILSWLVQLYMQLGVNLLLLHVVRGEHAEIGDLFRGGPYYLRMLASSFLFGLALVMGLVLCLVPGIIVALMFWPYALVLVDRNPSGLGCLSDAKTVTENNWGPVILLFFAAFGINLLGAMACCVGLIFTVPLTSLMFVVAYCGMTGQRTTAD